MVINLQPQTDVKVQQRGVHGTREMLEGLMERVEITDNKIIVADLTMNKLLGTIIPNTVFVDNVFNIPFEPPLETIDCEWTSGLTAKNVDVGYFLILVSNFKLYFLEVGEKERDSIAM